MQTPDIIALVLVSLIGFSFWKLHRDESSSFNIFDLIMENGKLGRLACVFMGAFFVASWVMIRVALDGKMTDAYLLAYCGAFVAPIIAKLFSAPPPAGTMTINSSSKTVVQPAVKPSKPKR